MVTTQREKASVMERFKRTRCISCWLDNIRHILPMCNQKTCNIPTWSTNRLVGWHLFGNAAISLLSWAPSTGTLRKKILTPKRCSHNPHLRRRCWYSCWSHFGRFFESAGICPSRRPNTSVWLGFRDTSYISLYATLPPNPIGTCNTPQDSLQLAQKQHHKKSDMKDSTKFIFSS